MNAVQPLLAVAALWTLAVVTPGPNFLMAAGIAARESRLAGLWAVPGIGLGTMIWGISAYFGVHILFAAVPWAYGGLKLFGGFYVILLGIRLLRSTGATGPVPPPRAPGSAMWLGLITSLSNPKSALFAASLFATAMPADPSLSLGLFAIAVMVTISLVWYSLVVCVVSTGRMARAYQRGRRWIDRLAGGIFVLFGCRLIASR